MRIRNVSWMFAFAALTGVASAPLIGTGPISPDLAGREPIVESLTGGGEGPAGIAALV